MVPSVSDEYRCIVKMRFKYLFKGLEVSYELDYDYGETVNLKTFKQSSDGVRSSNIAISADTLDVIESLLRKYSIQEWTAIPESDEKSIIRYSLCVRYDNRNAIKCSNEKGGIIPPNFLSFCNEISELLDTAEDLS